MRTASGIVQEGGFGLGVVAGAAGAADGETVAGGVEAGRSGAGGEGFGAEEAEAGRVMTFQRSATCWPFSS